LIRETETAYKAESSRKSTPQCKTLNSKDTANAAVALREFTFLSTEF